MLGFKQPREKSRQNKRNLVFLETTVHMVGGESRKPTKIQGSRKPRFFLLNFCNKKTTVHTPSEVKLGQVSTGFEQTRLKTIARLSAPL